MYGRLSVAAPLRQKGCCVPRGAATESRPYRGMKLIDESLRLELLQMRESDQAVREELAADGSLFDGYHPRMEEVHRRNAARLAEIIEQHGWPGGPPVAEDGADAAWIIVQHAIGEPEFQRRCLVLLKDAAAKDDIPLSQPAYLDDRIRTREGNPQLYGTQYDWDPSGEINPLPIEDADRVDQRRRTVGLVPLAENTEGMREAVRSEKEQPPRDFTLRRKEFDDWAHKPGWRQ